MTSWPVRRLPGGVRESGKYEVIFYDSNDGVTLPKIGRLFASALCSSASSVYSQTDHGLVNDPVDDIGLCSPLAHYELWKALETNTSAFDRPLLLRPLRL